MEERRAEYGKQVLKRLAERLTDEYGENDNYPARDSRNYRQFVLTFNDFPKWYARVPNLTWTHYRTEGDNPTIGLLLCAETSKDLARYSILHDNNQLFAAKYLTYLPKKEELLAEIEQQKEFFELQNGKQHGEVED